MFIVSVGRGIYKVCYVGYEPYIYAYGTESKMDRYIDDYEIHGLIEHTEQG